MESRPYVENVTITPQVAQMMLEHNTHNRNLTESRAQAYARDMASGNWRYTGEGIKFGPDGTLLDGQTRLRAIVDVSKGYTSFSGVSADTAASVKFIFRSDSIG